MLSNQDHGKITSVLIVEAEAYQAPQDNTSHAFHNRKTSRSEAIFLVGGHTYICCGIYQIYNVTKGPEAMPKAISTEIWKRQKARAISRRNHPQNLILDSDY